MATKAIPNIRRNVGGGAVVRYEGQCTSCKKWITAPTRRQWQRAVREPCPHYGLRGW